MSERLSHPDNSPEVCTVQEAEALRTRIKELAKWHGSERKNRDGYTASFQLDSLRILTLRLITNDGEYPRGAYVSIWETVAEYEDGSSVQINRELEIKGTKKIPTVYYSERAVAYDADENEVPIVVERMEGEHIKAFNRRRMAHEAELELFLAQFDDHTLYGYQVVNLEELFDSITEAHCITCEDETFGGYK